MPFTKKDTNYAVADDRSSVMAGYPMIEYVKGERIVAIPTEKMSDGGLKVFLQEASEMQDGSPITIKDEKELEDIKTTIAEALNVLGIRFEI